MPCSAFEEALAERQGMRSADGPASSGAHRYGAADLDATGKRRDARAAGGLPAGRSGNSLAEQTSPASHGREQTSVPPPLWLPMPTDPSSAAGVPCEQTSPTGPQRPRSAGLLAALSAHPYPGTARDADAVLRGSPAKVLDQQTHFVPAKGARTVLPEPPGGSCEAFPAQPLARPEPVAVPALAERRGAGDPAGRPDAVKLEPASQHGAGRDGPAEQIAGAIVADIVADGAPAEAEAPRAAPAAMQERLPGAALKTLTIQLQPESLGVVRVVLRSGARALCVRLEAEQGETASSLERDRIVIAGRIADAGYVLDELIVTRAEGTPAPNESTQVIDERTGRAADGTSGSPAGSMPQRRQQQGASHAAAGALAAGTVTEAGDDAAGRAARAARVEFDYLGRRSRRLV